jgi:hypothetical protein
LDTAIVLRRPAPAVGGEPFQRRLRHGLGEALAEDHLAVDAAIDLVIHILDAGAGEITGDPVKGLASMNFDGCFLALTQRHESTQDTCKTKDG